MKSIQQIKEELKTQPFEDVYSNNFAGKNFESECSRFAEVFDPYQPETEYLGQKKIKDLLSAIEIRLFDPHIFYIPASEIKEDIQFPSFIEIYLAEFYDIQNGLKCYSKKYCHPYAIQIEPNFGGGAADYEYIVNHYESQLVNKKWLTDVDKAIWSNFMVKRKRAKLYEKEITWFRDDLHDFFLKNGWPESSDDFQGDYFGEIEKIINKHHNDLRNTILELKLAGQNDLKIETLELLSEYILNKKNDTRFTEIKKRNFNDKHENLELLESISSKLILLKELGIYDHLSSTIENNSKSKTDLKKLISYIIGESNPQSVGRYFPYMNIDKLHKDRHNPYTDPAIKEMKRVLTDCNIQLMNDYSKFNKSE